MSQPSPALPPSPPTVVPVRIYRQSFARKVGLGAVRLVYRQWTRVAARMFPEGSRRALAFERLGIPLPDRLDYSWITEDLAVGGRIRAGDVPRVQRAGIASVVDVREEHRDDEDELQRHGIALLYLPTPDTYPLSLEDMRRGAAWINAQRQAGRKVLVHCEHGVGRSVLLAAAALVCEGHAAHDAFALIARKRWQASPNLRQSHRLHEFEQSGACQS